jgi:hypothetical protein
MENHVHTKILTQITHDLFDQAVMSNLARPLYVERLVAQLLGDDWTYVGGNWSGWDIQRSDLTRIEVKQSAARQVWSSRPSRLGKRTKPIFDIGERSCYYADDGTRFVPTVGRPADIYIFAWHEGYEPKNEVDHRDPKQWTFYLVPEFDLPRPQKTISLSRIRKLGAVETGADQLSRHISLLVAQLPTLKHAQDGCPPTSKTNTNLGPTLLSNEHRTAF